MIWKRPKPAPRRQRDLFGAPAAAVRDHTPVTVRLDEHPASHTEKALALSAPGKPFAFAPRAEIRRGEGPGGEMSFTMPRWLAAEKGWL